MRLVSKVTLYCLVVIVMLPPTPTVIGHAQSMPAIVYLESAGMGGNAYDLPPVPAKGLIAVTAGTGKELFTLKDAYAILAEDRRHLYSREGDRISIFEAQNGSRIREITFKEPTAASDPGYCCRGAWQTDAGLNFSPDEHISSDDHWLYARFSYMGNDLRPDFMLIIDLNQSVAVPHWVNLHDSCETQFVPQSKQYILLVCWKASMVLNLATDQVETVDLGLSSRFPSIVRKTFSIERRIIYLLTREMTLTAWDTQLQQSLWQIVLDSVPSDRTVWPRISLSRDGLRLVVDTMLSDDRGKAVGNRFQVFDTQTGSKLSNFETALIFRNADLSTDAKILYGVINRFDREQKPDDTYVEIDMATGQTLHTFTRFGEVLWSIHVAP